VPKKVLVGQRKQLKQMIQIEHNNVTDPNWPEVNQLAIYKPGQGSELAWDYQETNPGRYQSGTQTQDR